MTIKSVMIVGAGALGCYFAACLAESGLNVTVIDIDRLRLDTIAAEGILVRDGRGERRVAVQAVTADMAEEPVDLVMLFTKGMHSATAIGSVRHLATPDTLALTLQNGLGNAEIIAEIFAEERVLIGMTEVPADLEGPNAVSSKGKSETALGAFRPCGAAGVDVVAEALRMGGFNVDTSTDVHTRIWEKLAFNTAINAVSTITGRPNGGMNSAPGRRLLYATAGETIAVASALGIAVNAERVLTKIANALVDHSAHRPSMLEDFSAGRMTEIESINVAVVKAGKSVGLPTPINATLAELVRMMEAH